MPAESRDIVRDAVTFQHPSRLPRDLWGGYWAPFEYPEVYEEILRRWPNDIAEAPDIRRPGELVVGTKHRKGTYVDEWGCEFLSADDGLLGEVQVPPIRDMSTWQNALHVPDETLPDDPASARDAINRACSEDDRFLLACCCPRPWERYQFLRGTEEAMIDMIERGDDVRRLLRAVHEHYLRELEFWVTTDVDGIRFMDDWGAQQQLLIPPDIWRELYRPLYRDYVEMIHGAGKLCFFHTDGDVHEIFGDFVDLGIDAINSQLFCMDLPDLAERYKGKICFWGEIDRQHVLTGPPDGARQAVRLVAEHLYDPAGGLIAPFEFGPGSNVDAVRVVYDEWGRIQAERDAT